MISTFATSLIKNSMIVNIGTKAIDYFIVARINNKIEEKKWLRLKKRETLARLSEDIISFDINNHNKSIENVKKSIAKIIIYEKNFDILEILSAYTKLLDEYNKKNCDSCRNDIEELNNQINKYLKYYILN